jgi:hypothetical protein
MPNAIKYSTTIPTGSLLKGTVALGVTTASISGPTSITGWYYGPEPVTGKYQIFETAASGDPDVYCPQSDAELIQFVKSKGATGANTASLSSSLTWIATQPNLLASNRVYPNIVTSGSILNLDAGFVGSYPLTGSIWYDLSGNNYTGSLTNTSFISEGVTSSIALPNTSSKIESPIISSVGSGLSLSFNVKLKQPFDQIQIITSQTNTYSQAAQPSVQFNVFCITWLKNGSAITETLYLNGSSVQISNYTNANFDINSALVLNFLTNNNAGNSQVQDILVYNRVLTANEVLQNYQATI